MSGFLQKDSALVFPSVQVVTASAGSGKTHALTQRLLQFLLSDRIVHSNLRQILAVTFTNHAAMEMKQRLLAGLKDICKGKKTDYKPELLLDTTKNDIRRKACAVIDRILDCYSDFQVKTIDSFMTSVFKASAIEFGFSPETEISLQSDRILDLVFDQLARDLDNDTDRDRFFRDIVELVMFSRRDDDSYLWDPYLKIKRTVKELYAIVGRFPEPLKMDDGAPDLWRFRNRIVDSAREISRLVSEHENLVIKLFLDDLEYLSRGDVNHLLRRSPRDKFLKKDAYVNPAISRWATTVDRLGEALTADLREYAWLHARHFYQPFVRMIHQLDGRIRTISRDQVEVYLGDVHRRLADHLHADDVPEMYQRLGEQISHFLIDEFQDTTPIQWSNLRLLVENALASGGSLFVVGDTKQSIYAFNGADWEIMRGLERREDFPSAADYQVHALETNYRSDGVLVDFCKDVFHNRLRMRIGEEASGLSRFVQESLPGRRAHGYVTCHSLDKAEEEFPEREYLLEAIAGLRQRGFNWKDIAILTPDNYDVVHVSSWLNEGGVPFISHSSLDVRRRKLTGEIISLLRFLNSPIDDLSFATFITGEAFRRFENTYHSSSSLPDMREMVFEFRRANGGLLYKHFERTYGNLWRECFADLFVQVGYLPLYDLATQLYDRFHVFDIFPEESATAAKLLEIFKDFERNENNSLKDFLDPAFEDRMEWEIHVPADAQAVQVMTIHKAKGLGFPATIVLQYGKNAGLRNPLIVRESDGVALWHITSGMESWDPRLEEVRAAEQRKKEIDEWNRLYVALTRAKHEMHVIAVGDPKKYFDFLPPMPFSTGIPVAFKSSSEIEEQGALVHVTGGRIPVKKDPSLVAHENKRRGDRMHAVLEKMNTFESEWESQIKKIAQKIDPDFPVEDAEQIIRFLKEPGIRRYFEKTQGRTIRTEQEFVQANGELFRMDRVVVDPGEVVVIDFKTGEEQESYREQVLHYMSILRLFYPDKAVRGMIAYVDKIACREVR